MSTDVLIDLVAQKCTCLEQLLELGQRQHALVDQGDMSALLQLLGVKQQLLTDLQRIELQLGPFQLEQPGERVWRSEALRARCGELLAKADALFREILAVERRSEEQLRARRDETARNLHHLQHATRATHAYIDNTVLTSQLDLTSQS